MAMPMQSVRSMILSTAFLSALVFVSPTVAAPAAPGEGSEVGSVWWSELVTPDAARATHFYSTVLGWKPRVVAADEPTRSPSPGESTYTVMMSGAHDTAGILRIEGPDTDGLRTGWLTYIQVADVDLAALAAVQNGGRIVKAAFDIPEVARMAILEDPLGVQFGIVKPVE